MAKSGVGERQAAWEQRQQEREARWRGHLRAWQRGGGSQAEYCRRHGLLPADFSYWKHELARRDRRNGESAGKAELLGAGALTQAKAPFVPVMLKPEKMLGGAAEYDCELVLANGRRLRIGPAVTVERVIELAAALESLPC